MPGKVNPVIPEVMNIIAFRVMANDYAVTLAAHSGQLQLNAYEPLAGLSPIESQASLYRGSMAMRTKCIDGITVNEKVLAHYMETTVGIVTALNPVLGLREGDRACGRSLQDGKGNPGDHPGEEDPDRTADQRTAGSCEAHRTRHEQVHEEVTTSRSLPAN